jgi:hypothetical protein
MQELLALVPAPLQPTNVTEAMDWDRIAQVVGTRLPADYRAYALHYGSGWFDDGTYTFRVINPFAPNYPTLLADALSLWKDRRAASPWEYPADIFPAVPGLLPWGQDEDGGMMGWLVEGSDPDRWAVVTKGHGDEAFEQFDLPLTTFLAQSLSHQLRPNVWRPDYPEDIRRVVFQPDQS